MFEAVADDVWITEAEVRSVRSKERDRVAPDPALRRRNPGLFLEHLLKWKGPTTDASKPSE